MGIRERLHQRRQDEKEVTCIACGETMARSEAREYDKHGNRWERDGKQFEFLCKPCHRDCCHQSRHGLEATLVAAGAGSLDQQPFLRRYHELATETPAEDSGRYTGGRKQ